ncbi:MAG: ABC transporter ATP-binding protein/permease [Lachnospiraceae bacterium]|nr:ABC transporter ATP-binding protein/permease [Lachnospiraceae bacterium]
MKQETEKYGIKQVLSNNLFLLNHIGRVSPWRIPSIMVNAIADWSKGLIFRVFVVGYVLNQIQSSTPLPKIFSVVGLLALLSFACHLVNILLKNCFFPRSDLKIQSHFMKLAFGKAREVDLECYENAEYFEKHIRALNALKSRPRMVLDSIEMLFGALFGFLALSGLALSLDVSMILFIALQIIANFVFARKENYERRAYEVELAESSRQADYIRRVHYMPEYAKELRTTNISDVLFKRFITATQNGIKVIEKHGFKCAVYRLFVDAVCTRMGYYLVILFTAFRILVLRNMMIGDGLMVVMAMFSVTEALLDQENSFFQLHEHAMYIGDLRGFLDYEPKIQEDEAGAVPEMPVEELRVQNLSFSYFGSDKKVIDDISFTIKGGQTAAIVGHNGAGKSTLVKLLMHLYEPDSGKIYLNDREISEYKLSAYRDSFSTVFQDFKVFSLTVGENILMRRTAKDDAELIATSLRESGMMDNVSSFKYGFDTMMTREFDDEGVSLSGGQNQKIALSRLYAKGAPIAILDEPSSALDPIAEYELFENMKRICKGRTVIFISHRLSSAVSADVIFMMEHGRIIERGDHESLMQQNGKYAEMFRKQAEKYE